MTETNTVPVYRVENPNIPARPDGVVSHENLVGQWFTPELEVALGYMRKSTHIPRGTDAPIDGTQLVVAYVPKDQLDSMHVSKHPVAASMDVENDNYVVPRDGSVPTEVLPLDEALGELRGQLGNVLKQREARERVHALLGETTMVEK